MGVTMGAGRAGDPGEGRPSSGRLAAQAAGTRRRVDSLEGLRSLAILSVVAYHLGLAWLPSGHMGVVMFLVLTGYLVTCSVVRGFERERMRCLPRFWLRRVRRIWPSMAVMVVVVCALCVGLDHVLLTKMRPDVLPSLLGFANWADIARGSSYFDQIGSPSPLTHLWYVGVDAQLCLVWPLVLACLLRAGASRTTLRRVALVLALASAVAMGLLYVPGADPSRVYYGTDTRAFAVLIGAWLGLAWTVGEAGPLVGGDLLERVGPRGMTLAGALSLVGLVVVMAACPSTSPFFFYGGMVLVCLLTVVLLVALLTPGDPLARAFGCRPAVWLGSRSYALYLWHYPIVILLGAQKATAAWWLVLLAVALSLVAAELSWRVVEGPVASGALGRAWEELRDGLGRRRSLGAHGARGRRSAVADARGTQACEGEAGRGERVSAARVTPVDERPSVRGRVGRGSGRGMHAAGSLRRVEARPGLSAGALRLACGGVAGTVLVLVALVGCIVVPETTLVPQEAIRSTGEAADKAIDLGDLVVAAGEATDAGTDAGTGGAAGDAVGTDAASADAATGDAASADAATGDAATEGASTDVAVSDAGAVADEAADHPTPEQLTAAFLADGTLPADYFGLTAWAERSQGVLDPFLIGDSVPGDSPFYEWFPDGFIDSYIGRSPTQALSVFEGYASQSAVGHVVVFACFSNSTPSPETLDAMVEAAGEGRQVYLVGTVNPDGFQDAANQNLIDCAARHDNCHYVDWPATSAGHESEWFWDDQTHLRPEGSEAYLDMIARAIAADVVAAGGQVSQG